MKDLNQRIRLVQRRFGLEDDGIVGTLTIGAVEKLLDERDLIETSAECQVPSDQWEEGLDERSVSNIRTLDPKVRPNFGKFTRRANATAATMGCSYVMIGGDRSWSEQDRLYEIGRATGGAKVTNARGGQSNHNFKVAGDYGVFRGKAYLDTSDARMAAKVHKAVSIHAKECGLEWGGSWASFKDLPHYEFPVGMTMAQKRAKFLKEGSVV